MAMLSSPLAAMQPPTPPRWASDSYFHHQSMPTFNFSNLGMKRQSSDSSVFNQKPSTLRGSSPSASLAADLSQNFYIDQSPQIVTPRRCLFQSGSGIFNRNLACKEGNITPVRWEGVTTPPIPSSSPAIHYDNMDRSPLPHKPPFSFTSKLSCASTVNLPSSQINNVYVTAAVSSVEPEERRRPPFRRPSLNRQRYQSTSALPQSHHFHLPSFTFGAGGDSSAKSSSSSVSETITTTTTMSTSLEDCFKDSPKRDSTCYFSQGLGSIIPRIPFSGMLSARGPAVSLPAGLPRQDVSQRPRKQMRRSLSMFEHPADIIKCEEQSSLDVVMDMENDQAYQLSLPNFIPEDKPNTVPRISQDTMISVLDGQYKNSFESTMVIDCRFEYEFNGGHIDGALNFNDKDSLARSLFNEPRPNRTLIVLHCEYSAHRAPIMAQYIRQQDRSHNATQYPKLSYPEVYILDGGYSSFFKNHRLRCFPQNYVEMDSKDHEQACERGLNRIRQRSKLSRAKTFAFGQRMSQIQESPSRGDWRSAEKTEKDGRTENLQGGDSVFGRHPPSRRTASY